MADDAVRNLTMAAASVADPSAARIVGVAVGQQDTAQPAA